MAHSNEVHSTIDKLYKGTRFGFFEDTYKCYFSDGQLVSYQDLLRALRAIYKPKDLKRSLKEICPKTFVGAFEHPFEDHIWKQK
jgi:hypothetical protein